MNAWENVPHDPLMTDDELEELYSRDSEPIFTAFDPKRHVRGWFYFWWHAWWPKLACLVGVCAFWLLFWYGASR